MSDDGYVTYVLVRLPVLLAGGAIPDDAPALTLEPPSFVRWGADELTRRDAALATRVGPDRSARETLADFGSSTRSHRFRFIHRDADGRLEIYDDIIDVVFVKSGAGQVLVGGEMIDRDGSVGTGIAGGTRHPVAAGDMLHIPAGCRTDTSSPTAATSPTCWCGSPRCSGNHDRHGPEPHRATYDSSVSVAPAVSIAGISRPAS